MTFITLIFFYIALCHYFLQRWSRILNLLHCPALMFGTNLMKYILPEYSDETNAFLDGVPFPSPDIEEENNHMDELVNYTLPRPHQHVEAPTPDTIPGPSKLSMASATPSKKRQPKATPKAPAKRRRKSPRSPSCSPSRLPRWTDDEKQKLRTLKTDEKSRFSWRVIASKMGRPEQDVRSMWNKIKDKLGWPDSTDQFFLFDILSQKEKSPSCSQGYWLRYPNFYLHHDRVLPLYFHSPSSAFWVNMSLRTHLERYCMQRAMAPDLISSPTTRSRSPTGAPSSSTGTSPFHRPPGWTPPTTTPHRPVILKIDLKPMQQLADRNPYYNILAPQVAGNLFTDEYDSLFQTFKVIYPDYASRHFVEDLKNLAIDTMTQRWSIYLRPTDFYLMVDTDQGIQILDDLPHSILDILNWYYPTWKIHQHLAAFTIRSSSGLPLVPHPDKSDTGLLVYVFKASLVGIHSFHRPGRPHLELLNIGSIFETTHTCILTLFNCCDMTYVSPYFITRCFLRLVKTRDPRLFFIMATHPFGDMDMQGTHREVLTPEIYQMTPRRLHIFPAWHELYLNPLRFTPSLSKRSLTLWLRDNLNFGHLNALKRDSRHGVPKIYGKPMAHLLRCSPDFFVYRNYSSSRTASSWTF